MFNFFRRNTKKEDVLSNSVPEAVGNSNDVTTSQKDNNKRPKHIADVTLPTQSTDTVTATDVDKNSRSDASDGCALATVLHVPGHEQQQVMMAPSRGRGKGKIRKASHHNNNTSQQNTDNTVNTIVPQDEVQSIASEALKQRNSCANILQRPDAVPEKNKSCTRVATSLGQPQPTPTISPKKIIPPSSASKHTQNTVRGTIQLRIDMPSASLTAVRSGNNDAVTNEKVLNSNEQQTVDNKIEAISERTNNNNNSDIVEREKKNLVNQETKFHTQLNELTEQLQSKETETAQLKCEMEDLQRDIYVKTSAMERLQAELQAAYTDTECVRQKLKHLQEEVHVFKQKNIELYNEIEKKSEEFKRLETNGEKRIGQLQASMAEQTEKLQGFETQLGNLQEERNQLEMQRTALETEREEEKRIVQEALEAAMGEKETIKKRWEEDFEKLRTVNTDREQQMLDDFEWKLRQVQQMCKRRLDEKEKQIELRIKETQKDVDAKIKQAEQQMKEVVHLKSYEAEVSQLRGLTHDQQHSLRTISTRVDELQLAEQNLMDDIGRLQAAVEIEKQKQETLVRKHEKDLVDRERSLQIRLEKQRNEVAVQWEQKLRQECVRLKTELEQMHGEEKHLAVELVKVQKDREFEDVRNKWEHIIQKQVREIAELKTTQNKNEDKHSVELERLQTNTDRDIMELRRELDRVEMSYHERIEKMDDEHEIEIGRLNEDTNKRIKEIEQNCQMQVSSMRVTLELVKEQMERETQDRLQHLINNHERTLDEERDRLTVEKNEQVDQIEHGYKCKFDMLKEKFTTVQKSHQVKETELLQLIESFKQEISEKKIIIDDLQANVDTLHGGVQVLNQEMANQDQKFIKAKTDAETKIGEMQQALKIQRDMLQVEREEQVLKVQQHSQAVIEQLQRKCQCLTKLFEEMRSRYDKRESRTEDVNLIADLQAVIAAQEKDLAIFNQQKQYFQQMELKRHMNGDLIADDAETDLSS